MAERFPWLRLAGRVGGPGLAGRLVAFGLRRRSAGDDTPRVLWISKLQFSKDVSQLERRTSLGWVSLSNGILTEIQKLWVSKHLRRQTHFSVIEGREADATRRKCEVFARAFLATAVRRSGIAAVLSANTDYWQEEGLRRACRAMGVPFLVLCREHDIVPAFVEEKVEHYRGLGFRFDGAGVAVFGPVTVDTLVRGGVCGHGAITITGAPRMDAWRDMAPPDNPRLLTLLSYSNPAYFAPDNFRETLETFARVSRDHPAARGRVVVKCKSDKDRDEVLRLLAGIEGHGMDIVIDRPMTELLRESRFVIGFNSLALLEGLLCDAELAVPAWADARRKNHELMLWPDDPDHASVFTFVDSPDALRRTLERHLEETLPPADRPRRRGVFRSFFHYPDAFSCSIEVERFIRARIDTPEGRHDR